jgi:rhodanese-related sulfurtransferase
MSTLARTLLALLALSTGALAAIAGSPRPAPAADEVEASELAGWIRDRRPGLFVLDARSAAAFDRDRLPGARRLADVVPDALHTGAIVVVYADRRVDDAVVESLRGPPGARRVLRLHGGVEAWNEDVLFPVIRADASAARRRAFEPRAQLSRYFGGSPRVLEPGATPSRSRRGC